VRAAWLCLGLLVGCGDDAGSGDGGRDAFARDAGTDARLRDSGPRDAGAPAWVPLPEGSVGECTIERAVDPERTYPRHETWRDCGPGCRELAVPLGPGSVFPSEGWYDPVARQGYFVVWQEATLLARRRADVSRIIDLNGATRLALHGYLHPLSTDVRGCVGGVDVIGSNRWAAGALATRPGPNEYRIWQGALGARGEDAVATAWTAEDSGPVVAVSESLVVARAAGGRWIERVDPSGARTQVGVTRASAQRIKLVRDRILWTQWDDTRWGYGLRIHVDGEYRDLIVPPRLEGQLEVINFATDGETIVWRAGRVIDPAFVGPDRWSDWMLMVAPYVENEIVVYQRVTALSHGGIPQVSHGYASVLTDDRGTLVRLSDGARWTVLPSPPDAPVRLHFQYTGALFHTPDEVALPINATSSGEVLAVRLLRWDSLGPPDFDPCPEGSCPPDAGP